MATTISNRVRSSIRKGEAVMVPIVVLNRLPEIWGEDSHTFQYVNCLVEFSWLV